MQLVKSNQNYDAIRFVPNVEIINQDYNGPVYEFNGRAYSLEVTPNHRVINYNIRQNNKLEDTFVVPSS